MRTNTYTENRYSRVTELEIEFLKNYYCFGNLPVLGRILGRSEAALRNIAYNHGIKYNRGQKSLPESKLREIWNHAQYRTESPMIKDLPQEAVVAPLPAPKAETMVEEFVKEEAPEHPSVCPCHADDTIIARRIGLIDGGELWVCARCGREIALRRGPFTGRR